jgi:hypothetical protein
MTGPLWTRREPGRPWSSKNFRDAKARGDQASVYTALDLAGLVVDLIHGVSDLGSTSMQIVRLG